jgi:hypothetical protein
MSAKYPSGLASLKTTSANGDASKDTHPALHNEANAEINAIEAELGTEPKGSKASVKARLESIEADAAVPSTQGLALGEGARSAAVGNVSIGYDAANESETPQYCVAIGWKALANSVGGGGEGSGETGNLQTAVGAGALTNNTVGSFNTAIGFRSLYNNTTGIQNNGLGVSTLEENKSGSFNTAIGAEALEEITSGDKNTALGVNAMRKVAGGSFNTVVGFNALWGVKNSEEKGTGQPTDNVVVGVEALKVAVESAKNVAIGNYALKVTTGSENVAIGHKAMQAGTSGKNVVLGFEALPLVESGSRNVAIGFSAGEGLTEFSEKNVIIGNEAGPSAVGAQSNRLYIHNARSDSPLIYGNFKEMELHLNPTKLALYSGVTPVKRAAAIASPAAEAAALKTAVDKIRTALTNIGITE